VQREVHIRAPKKATDRGVLTVWRVHSEGQVMIYNGREQAKGTHGLESGQVRTAKEKEQARITHRLERKGPCQGWQKKAGKRVTHQLESAESGENLGKRKKASKRTEGTHGLESTEGGKNQVSEERERVALTSCRAQ
jgi:hypothetical protein